MKVVIVGGGVAGCSAALFLKKLSSSLSSADPHSTLSPITSITIYEKYSSPPAISTGAGLGLGANGLLTLALYDEEVARRVYERGHPAGVWEMRDWDGVKLGEFPAGREGLYGPFGSAFLRRWDVHDVLLKEVEEKGIEIRYGKQVASLDEIPDSDSPSSPSGHVRITFTDGSTELADLVIGADGARSKVREYVAPEAKIVYTGNVGLGGFVKRDQISEEVMEKGGIGEGYFER